MALPSPATAPNMRKIGDIIAIASSVTARRLLLADETVPCRFAVEQHRRNLSNQPRSGGGDLSPGRESLLRNSITGNDRG